MDSEDRQESHSMTTKTTLKSTGNKRVGESSARTAVRMPYSGSKKVYSGFKSPAPSTGPRCAAVVQPSLEQEIAELKRKQGELDYEIVQLESNGVGIKDLEQHIDLLHEYNDIKDIGQTLLGRLADVRGVTTRDLYSQFRLELDD